MKYIKLEDIKAYRDSSVLSDLIWDVVSKWDWFAKQTLGTQLVRSIDCIGDFFYLVFCRNHIKLYK